MKIGRWQTPFELGDLYITGLFWGGDFILQLPGGKRYQIKNTPHPGGDLSLELFHLPSEGRYRLHYHSVTAFRMLDEHGLLELWQALNELGDEQGYNSRLIKDHAWSRESPISFFHRHSDGWSHLICTGDECVEVLCPSAPEIIYLGKCAAKED